MGAFVRGQAGDFNKLKNAFLQQQIVETYGRNLQNLRTALGNCAAGCPQHAAFLSTLSEMLSGRRMEWRDLQTLLNGNTPPVAPLIVPSLSARKFSHRRQHTSDTVAAMS